MSYLFVIATGVLLVGLTTLLHYEVLRWLHGRLPTMRIARRPRVLVVAFVIFGTHLLEIMMFGVAFHLLMLHGDGGTLPASEAPTWLNAMYLSAQTYTSLGFGDVAPFGAVRLLVGIEALQGLLLIAWSASFLYLAMERFWKDHGASHRS